MKFVIKYTDGAYEYKSGSGFPSSLDEAKRFETREAAEAHAQNLCGVECIEEIK